MDETEQPAAAAEAPKTDSQGRELMTVPGGRILSLRPANQFPVVRGANSFARARQCCSQGGGRVQGL